MTAPILVASPGDFSAAVVQAMATPAGTLVWPDPNALRNAVDTLQDFGWDVLVVDPADEALSGAALGHRSQIHGIPAAIVLAASSREEIDPVVRVGELLSRDLQEVPIVLTGSLLDSLEQAWIASPGRVEGQPVSRHSLEELSKVFITTDDPSAISDL
jgi:hypothetical protein